MTCVRQGRMRTRMLKVFLAFALALATMIPCGTLNSAGCSTQVAYASESQPEVGDAFYGTATTTYVKTGSNQRLEYATISIDSGICAELGALTVHCADHTAAAPYEGQTHTYTYTVTSVNKTTGEVTGTLFAVPDFAPSDGVTMANGCLSGYQRLSGSATIWRTYGGYIQLYKSSGNPSVTNGNASYTLAGAVFGIYSDPGCTNLAARLETNTGGYAGPSPFLNAGSYWIREIYAPRGFQINTQIQHAYVEGGTATVYFSDTPVGSSDFLVLDKHDAETPWDAPTHPSLGSGTLHKAQYSIDYYDRHFTSADDAENSGAPTRKWIFQTTEDGRIDLANADNHLVDGVLYRDSSGKALFPIGSYVVKEVLPSIGYLASSEKSLLKVVQDGSAAKVTGDVVSSGGRVHAIEPEQAIRADLKFTKVRESDMARLARAPFRLTSDTTGESHILVTDDNGFVNTAASWNPHSRRTNMNDFAVDASGLVDESALDPFAGVWFGKRSDGTFAQPDDSLCALPYDTYTLEELRCSANEGLSLVRIEGISAKRDSASIDMGTIDNRSDQSPCINTTAHDAIDLDKAVCADTECEIVDHVEYMNLTPGSEYALESWLVDAKSGLPIDGAKASRKFVATSANGFVDVSIKANLLEEALDADRVVAFEELWCKGAVVAEHKEVDDVEQTLVVSHPKIGTFAKDDFDGDKHVIADAESAIVDEVSYCGLVPGKEYTLEGTVMTRGIDGTESGMDDADGSADDKHDSTNRSADSAHDDTGDVVPFFAAGGEEAKATLTFTPEAESGCVSMRFPLNTCEAEEGTALVIYESLLAGDAVVATHQNPDDAAQTVFVKQSTVSTYASDVHDGDKEVIGESGAAVTDEVRLTNLMPGRSYTVYGVVVDAASGLPTLLDSPKKNAFDDMVGNVDIAAEDEAPQYSADDIEEQDVAAFWRGLLELLGMSEVRDDGGISLSADKNFEFDADRLQEYLAENRELASRMVVVSTDFDAEEAKASTSIAYEMDASGLEGEYVIFDLLTSENKVVSVHADSKNELQSFDVVQPALATEAADATDNDHMMLPSHEASIIDSVFYEGLLSGHEYSVHGMLMDAQTGEPLYVDDKTVESTKSFTPNESSGYVEVTFGLDASGLAEGAQVVVYERLYRDGELLASHADLRDEMQTVTISSAPRGTGYYKTGIDAPTKAAATLAAAGGLIALWAVLPKRLSRFSARYACRNTGDAS